MKTMVISILLFNAISYASIPHCNPVVYNEVYKRILITTIKSNLGAEIFKARNDSIETLRKLCYGQRSKWETGHETRSISNCK